MTNTGNGIENLRGLTESDWMQRMLQRSPGGPYTPTCKRCMDTQVVYEPRPYIVNGVKWGDFEQQVPCPDCTDACSNCDGKGVVGRLIYPVGHPNFGKLEACPYCKAGQHMAEAMQRALLTTAQLPDQFKEMTFATWDRMPNDLREKKRLARAAAGLFVEASAAGFYVDLQTVYARAGNKAIPAPERRNSLVFQGPVGMGKTGLVAAIVNALAHSFEHNIRYLRLRELIGVVQKTYNKQYQGPTKDDILQEFCKMPLLILDEFNVSRDPKEVAATDDRADMIETIIRYRYNNLMPTVFTLNADKDELEAEWGIRTATALRAMAHWFPVGGKPLRNEGVDIPSW